MNFENDIFISYALTSGDENQTLKTWTSLFCEYLTVLMNRLYDKKPAILMHDDLRIRQTVLGENTQDVFSRTAVFVTILSPEYMKYPGYIKELEQIYQVIAMENTSVMSEHRIFKVVTQPLVAGGIPEFLNKELNYNFFEINRYSKKPITFDFQEKDGPNEKFWSKLVDLAYDIADTLGKMSGKNSGTSTEQKAPAVFLAETTFDQTENRDMLKRELQHLGYRVLPELAIPDSAEQAGQDINYCLKQSILTIHLMGAWYGDFIRNSKYSLIDFQIKTVKDYISSRENTYKPKQIIWISSDVKPTDQRQLLYLKRLKRDEAQRYTEIIETPFEVFKTVLNSRLDELTGTYTKPVAEKNKLYLIYEKSSRNEIGEYINLIKEKGFSIFEPHENGEDFFPLSKHINYLLTAEAVLIYRGDSTMEWLNSKIRDLVKAPGYGKSTPFRAVEIISSLKTADKSLLFLKNVPVNWDEEINATVINHFLDHLLKK